jgi:AcrR family transcriptional regulator
VTTRAAVSAGQAIGPTDTLRGVSKGSQTRLQIVQSALRLFAERGYDRTTMRAIAAEAGVSVGNAYYYFASKEQLVQGFYDQLADLHARACEDILARESGFEDRLREMLLEAHEERRRPVTGRRRRASMRRRGIGALMAATFVVGGWVAASSVVSDDTIEVDAAAAAEDPRAVERELREAGIDAEVRTVPEPDPYLRGKWLQLYFPPEVAVDPDLYFLLRSFVGDFNMAWPSVRERCPRGVGCERTSILELPRRTPGPIVLIAGRAPRAREKGWENVDPSNELAPTGALYCYRLEELSPTEAGRRLESMHTLGQGCHLRAQLLHFRDPVRHMRIDELTAGPRPALSFGREWG